MNKILVSLAASLAVLGLGFAQVPGGIQEAPRPGQVPFPLGQGGMRTGGGNASVAASGNFVYVVSGNTLYQFSNKSSIIDIHIRTICIKDSSNPNVCIE